MTDWIASPAQLQQALAPPSTAPVALDTEFIREKTYYPQLALVQLAQDDRLLLLDPLGLGRAEPFTALLASPVLKLMHSPSEDLQALRHHYGVLPRPLFDTQVAAALCGYGVGLGYQALIETLLGIRLEKGETRSDWLRRPLSPSQLQYAADDVLHLERAYELLDARLRQLGRREWLDQECERQLAVAERDEIDPQPQLGARSAQRMSREQQARLRRLLLWRERQARRSDKPRSWVLDNELVVDLAMRGHDRASFDAFLDASPRAPRKLRDELCEVALAPLGSEELDIPLAQAPDPRWREVLKRMQDAVSKVAAATGLPEGLLCARRHLESLLAYREWPAALDGWRRPLLEPALLPLMPKG